MYDLYDFYDLCDPYELCGPYDLYDLDRDLFDVCKGYRFLSSIENALVGLTEHSAVRHHAFLRGNTIYLDCLSEKNKLPDGAPQ